MIRAIRVWPTVANFGRVVSMAKSVVVLCVGDEPRTAGIYFVLSIAGYDVLRAHSGDAALRMLRLHRVDLVITEQFLSDRTGAELAEKIKQSKPRLPIALLVGSTKTPPGAGDIADLLIANGIYPDELLAMIEPLAAPVQTMKSSRR
jgi:two-component system, cell cycle sensor histidine kinase and response regulator CckA